MISAPLLFCTRKLERVRTCTHECYPINGTTWLEMPILHLCASINLKSTSLFDYENTAPTFASFGIQSCRFFLFKQAILFCELFTGIFSFTVVLSCCHIPFVEELGSIIRKASWILAKLSLINQRLKGYVPKCDCFNLFVVSCTILQTQTWSSTCVMLVNDLRTVTWLLL